VEEITNRVLGYIVEFLSIPLGAIYIRDDEEKLALAASYAYPSNGPASSAFKEGEGFVGQTARDGKEIFTSEIPESIRIDVGFDSTVPTQMLFMPLSYQEEVLGVLELGLWQKLDENQVEWLRQAAESLAVTIRLAIDLKIREAGEEELRIEKEKAESATQTKSDFLANMSHEIRTPMNAIIGMSNLALSTDLNPKQHDYIYKVSNSAHSLLGIINDILDFSKIEAGKLEMETIDFNFEEVLDKLADFVSDKINEKEIEFLINYDRDIPLTLRGDPLRLGQILLNLVNKAAKFADEGEIELYVE